AHWCQLRWTSAITRGPYDDARLEIIKNCTSLFNLDYIASFVGGLSHVSASFWSHLRSAGLVSKRRIGRPVPSSLCKCLADIPPSQAMFELRIDHPMHIGKSPPMARGETGDVATTLQTAEFPCWIRPTEFGAEDARRSCP